MRCWSTYRVQLHQDFGFAEASAVAEYLAALGVTHLYCSPYMQAAAGSTHGYDVVDPTRLNDELGGATAYASLVGELRRCGLAQVLDIVPNHMATDIANRWWWDVLENGPASCYAKFFDIDWASGGDKSAFTVLMPILDDHYGRSLEAGELRLERLAGSLVVHYRDHELPLSPRSLDDLLAAAARRAGSPELASLAEQFGSLTPARVNDDAAVDERHRHKTALAAQLADLCDAGDTEAKAVDAELAAINGDVERLDELLRRQNYRLAHWRTASEELDYRRFFNIETLIGVRVEDPQVFAETHRLVLDLVRDGSVAGLRVDHVDGLRDPEGYLAQLAEQSDEAFTVVEKILATGEQLPPTWAVAGTSGYDFLNRVNNLFVASANEQAMTDCYADFSGEPASFDEVARAAKRQVMSEDLAAEVERAGTLLATVCDTQRRHRDHTRRELLEALQEVVAHFPVYRTYVRPGRPATAADGHHVARAVEGVLEHRPDIDGELVRFIGRLALDEEGGEAGSELAQRLQQLTAPVMAKGVEDTAFYRYHRLISLNEVGGDPGTFGSSVAAFHEATAATAERWPETMLTLSTHDTKRSADVRARLAVLSEVPDAWRRAAGRWAEHNEAHCRDDLPDLDRNTEYLLYQTLVGAWPLDADRAAAFMAKATREAKVHTSWVDPDRAYDESLEAFVHAVLADQDFLADLERFLDGEQVVERGRRNSLAQTALLLTCPGVPDLYQGSELWDLSLVDPDNRRPVDYQLRRAVLDDARCAGTDAAGALARDERGDPKLWLVHRLLDHRRRQPASYATSTYEPLEASGGRVDDVVAFSRGPLVVVVPRLGDGKWGDTQLTLPPGRWRDVLTGAEVAGGAASAGELFARFPVAVLAGTDE